MRVVRERELLGIGEPGQYLLPWRRDVEQQQPADPQPVLGDRLGAGRQDPQRHGVTVVDERGVPLDQAPGRGGGGYLRGDLAEVPRAQTGALQRRPGPGHLPAQLGLGGLAQRLELGPAGDDAPPRVFDREVDPQVRRDPGHVPVLRTDGDAPRLPDHPAEDVGEQPVVRAEPALAQLPHQCPGVLRRGHQQSPDPLGQDYGSAR